MTTFYYIQICTKLQYVHCTQYILQNCLHFWHSSNILSHSILYLVPRLNMRWFHYNYQLSEAGGETSNNRVSNNFQVLEIHNLRHPLLICTANRFRKMDFSKFYFKLDFCCLYSLQNSSSKYTKNGVCQNPFFKNQVQINSKTLKL